MSICLETRSLPEGSGSQASPRLGLGQVGTGVGVVRGGLAGPKCWSGGGVVRGVSARCCCSKGRKWGLLPVGPSRLAGFNESGSVLLVGTLGAAGGRARKGRERGLAPPPQEVRLLVGRLVSRQDSVGSVLSCGFSPAPGRAFQAWGRGRLVSGLHSSVASGRPGPAGAQEPHSAIMGQWPSADTWMGF